MNKRGAADVDAFVWIPVIIIVFFGSILFLLAVLFFPRASAVDIYRKTSSNGVIQYDMLNALMKSKIDGRNIKDELKDIYFGDYSSLGSEGQSQKNMQASRFAAGVLDLLTKRGRGCYLFLVNTNNAFETKDLHGAVSFDDRLIIREVFYFLKNGQVRHMTKSDDVTGSNFENPDPSQAKDKAAYIETENKPIYFYVSQCGVSIH